MAVSGKMAFNFAYYVDIFPRETPIFVESLGLRFFISFVRGTLAIVIFPGAG